MAWRRATLIAVEAPATKNLSFAVSTRMPSKRTGCLRRTGRARESRAYVGNGSEFGGQRLLIVDPETARPLVEGHIGEIWVSGPAVASGYWNNEEATRNRLCRSRCSVEDPAHGRKFVRTGDIGALLDGKLFITGRLKDMMLFRGRCHYPNDIETTVADLDECLVGHGGRPFPSATIFEKLVIVQEAARGRMRPMAIMKN